MSWATSMTRQARYNLFQLINSLYEYRSIILTTNKDFTSWGEFFHDDNVAVPIIDRVIHHSHIYIQVEVARWSGYGGGR